MTEAPARYQAARYHVAPGAVAGEFAAEMGRWLYAHRRLMLRGGDGVGRFNYELLDVDKACEHLAPLRSAILTANEEFDPFDVDLVEMHATLYHHGSVFHWHTDDDDVSTRRVAFAYYLHTTPRMFTGGELEFLDGTFIEPEDGTLVLFSPKQRHRVRQVECWSAHVLHGRWALSGWLHESP